MPKIIGNSLEEHREQMRERIIDAFLELVREKGYVALTLAEVATRAGIGRTAMYNYFPDKETLLLAYTASETEQYLVDLRAELRRHDNPIDQLRAYLRMQLTVLSQLHVSAGSLAGVLSEQGQSAVMEHVMPLWGILRRILTEAIEEDYLPDGDLTVLLHLVSGSASGRWTNNLHGEHLESAIETATAFVLRGLGARLDAEGRPLRLTADPA